MSKPRPTPGPWTDSEKADGTGRRVIHGPAGLLIAVVSHAGNARLIAAAPTNAELASIGRKLAQRVVNMAGLQLPGTPGYTLYSWAPELVELARKFIEVAGQQEEQ